MMQTAETDLRTRSHLLIDVGDGGYFSDNYHVKFGNFLNFSGKYHTNAGTLIIFRAIVTQNGSMTLHRATLNRATFHRAYE